MKNKLNDYKNPLGPISLLRQANARAQLDINLKS
jgi:hypothetical protein